MYRNLKTQRTQNIRGFGNLELPFHVISRRVLKKGTYYYILLQKNTTCKRNTYWNSLVKDKICVSALVEHFWSGSGHIRLKACWLISYSEDSLHGKFIIVFTLTCIDRRLEPELERERLGARRLVAPRPASRLFSKDGERAQINAWNDDTVNTPSLFSVLLVPRDTCVSRAWRNTLYELFYLTNLINENSLLNWFWFWYRCLSSTTKPDRIKIRIKFYKDIIFDLE